METYSECCSLELQLFISFSSSIACFKTTVYVLVFFMCNVNLICNCFYNFNFNKTQQQINRTRGEFLKLILRVLKTVLKNERK